MPSLTLTELLECQQTGTALPDDSCAADHALLAGNYEEAIQLYREAADVSEETRAKQGFSAAMVGDDTSAEEFLTTKNVGTHPLALAILASVLGGPKGGRIDSFFSTEKEEALKHRSDTVSMLLDSALAVDRPHSFVFVVACDLRGTYSEAGRTLIARARSLYPGWAWAQGLYATSERGKGNFSPETLGDLMRVLPSAHHAEVFREAYVYAITLGQWGDAEQVVERLEALTRKDPPSRRAAAALAEMRAMVALHRARAGDPEAYEDILAMLAPSAGTYSWAEGEPYPLNVPRFLLDVALELHNEVNVRDAARAIVERAWTAKDLPSRGLDDWSPELNSPSLIGVLTFSHFGFACMESWQSVLPLLDEYLATRWRLLMAADAVLTERAGESELYIVRGADLAHAPFWAWRAAFEAFTADPADFLRAGEMLAKIGESDAGLATLNDEKSFFPSNFSVDSYDSGQVVEIFEGALTWLLRTPEAIGLGLLRGWAQIGIDNGGAKVVARIAQLSISRGDSEIASDFLALAQEQIEEEVREVESALTPQAALERWLTRYPTPEQTRVHPEELTLLEAATLIALFRASPLDHVRWTLAPLQDSQRKFEPTKKFIKVLFDLMQKGVIAADNSTPQGVIWVEDGKLVAYLDQVVWRVSTHTLELNRGIRDLALRDWPETWRSHAPILARDLGVEEMVIYQKHLLEERGLPTPDDDAAREIYRVQLERLAIAQCYYLAHKSMRETLDYQARYRPGHKQLQARMLNLLRGNGEKAVEKNWDTRYQRIRDIPASLLHEALHDVLTRWGTRAFDEPVMSLALDDHETLSTRH